MFKKLLLGLGIAGFLWLWSIALVNAWGSPTFDTAWSFWAWDTTGIAVWWTDRWWSLISVIKRFINWVLWLLSLITLVIVLFGWFKMVTAAGDEWKYKEWFKILKQAWIWLAVIGLSWFIVSIIFRVIWNSAAV